MDQSATSRKILKVRNVLRQVTVEPGMFLIAIGFFMSETASKQAIYAKICRDGLQDFYNIPEADDCANLETYPDAFQKYVTKENADFNRLSSIAGVVTPCLSILILSAWGDLVGRKVNILLGIAGMILQIYATIVVYSLRHSSINWILGASVVFGCLGQFGLAVSSTSQYVADQVEDKRLLAVRMTLVVALVALGVMVGNVLAAALIPRIGYNYTMIIAVILLTLAVAYIVIFAEQKPPPHNSSEDFKRLKSNESKASKEELGTHASDYTESNCFTFWRYIGNLLKDIWLTFLKPRHDKRRLWLFVIMISYLFLGMGKEGPATLMVAYLREPPISMGPSGFGALQAASGLTNAIGSTVASVVFRKLHTRDAMILIISLVSCIADRIVYCVAQNHLQIYISTFVGCLGYLGFGVFQSFVAQLVDPHEIGKVLAAESVILSISRLLGGTLLNSIYKRYDDVFRPAPMVATILFFFISLIIAVIVYIGSYHLMDKKRGRTVEVNDRF